MNSTLRVAVGTCEADRCESGRPAMVRLELRFGNGNEGALSYCFPCAQEFMRDCMDPDANQFIRNVRPDSVTMTRCPDVDYSPGYKAYQEWKEEHPSPVV